MVLGQPLYAYYGGKRTLLLGRGAEFSQQVIDRMQSMGYSSIYIEEEGIESVIPEDVLGDPQEIVPFPPFPIIIRKFGIKQSIGLSP